MKLKPLSLQQEAVSCCPKILEKKTWKKGREKRRENKRKILGLGGGLCSVLGAKQKAKECSFFSYFPALFGCLLGCEIKRRNPEKFGSKGGELRMSFGCQNPPKNPSFGALWGATVLAGKGSEELQFFMGLGAVVEP